MARQLLEAILDQGVANPNYFDGRLLTATALREDQHAHRARARHLGRALGPGVVDGLWVGLEFPGSATAPPLVSVSAGLAINGQGHSLELPVNEVIALARTTTTPSRAGADLFKTCEPPSQQVEGRGEGFYVLVVAPASGFRGRAPASGLSDPTAGAGCGSQWAMEGVRFRLLPLDPLAGTDLSAATRQLLETQLLGTTGDAGLSRLRNVVAHLCLGTEPLGTFAVDPFARETNTDGSTEAALADYGALDVMIDAGILTDCDVPLALVHWRLNGVEFLDNWSVRRRLAPAFTADRWPTLSGGRRRAEAEATLFQFQEQLAGVLARSSNPTTIRAADFFRWLPPACFVPMSGGGRKGFGATTFIAGLATRDPVIYIDGVRVPELVEQSLTALPIDTQSGEFVWTYRVRQNDLFPTDPGTEFPFLVLASGHLPYVGTARFNLARWDRSNFELL